MKTIPVALATHYNQKITTIAWALKITRTDSEIFGFTSHDQDASISGVTYRASPGLDVTSIDITASSAVGNLELTTLHDGTVFSTADVLGGVWRNAAFIIFRYNYVSISDGVENLLAGTVGELELRQNMVVAELRDLRQYLQQPVGHVSSKTCPYRLGDSRCRVNLASVGSPGGPFTLSGTLTNVTSNQVFRDSSRTEPADWFGEGEIVWLTGNNSSQHQKIKSYDANGTFTLALPMYSTVQVGNTYTAIAGCRKRLIEDCRHKFNNVLNFGGQPHRVGLNDIIKAPPVD